MPSIREKVNHITKTKVWMKFHVLFLCMTFICNSTLLLFILIDPGRETKNKHLLFLEIFVDVSIFIEVVLRCAFEEQFFKKWTSYVDIIITVVCLAILVAIQFHLLDYSDAAISVKVVRVCRISRDVLRFIRAIMFLKWLSESYIDLNIKSTDSTHMVGHHYDLSGFGASYGNDDSLESEKPYQSLLESV
eukprot:TRINITY_DN115600_c0_g1_i1.p1 TRINITY_DN115600_c0_g1~~TRINITY_DN115600_c0_g1_i1.p1  ORF type:complete len:190 (+),score=14.82 TRINITY_DN115600_c0_g1_i1:86-655(+)